MTPEDVRRKRFGTAPIGRHSYNSVQVNAFCARIADTLTGRDHLTAADIRLVEFDAPPRGQMGYDSEQVDDFLDQICVDLEFLRRGRSRLPLGRESDPLTPDDVLRIQFSAPPFGLRGYLTEEVGAFLDRLAATLAHHGPNGLTAEDVRHTTFHLASPGLPAYHRDEVDAFLDLVAQQLESARNGHFA
ncbi:DivIVA domain-containing protein [Nocardia yamanashiensis]|uniref:DivIVA domain-containing protein n=1 Tax=Nocardia yamanashiensis TaxID=209247 RepID=UPI000A0039B3|nr:DivIVA domain-containing protein [Nocardia yamanashiensis]